MGTDRTRMVHTVRVYAYGMVICTICACVYSYYCLTVSIAITIANTDYTMVFLLDYKDTKM